ncbi:hypothetical protein RFI_06309 [Reticulomyxa filosa]|uniref:Uncharacterized protein n=1 Tax=Reticulomyxa filosa TaxID=46433 RepID=X6NWW5_RETFI|nr:hypothetical protein RFI_06309 [Reticulomyxa filosa]|eukprot:ETO30810.1 hypothetical protein RFI_06309 [Reticulomyxa filosa]
MPNNQNDEKRESNRRNYYGKISIKAFLGCVNHLMWTQKVKERNKVFESVLLVVFYSTLAVANKWCDYHTNLLLGQSKQSLVNLISQTQVNGEEAVMNFQQTVESLKRENEILKSTNKDLQAKILALEQEKKTSGGVTKQSPNDETPYLRNQVTIETAPKGTPVVIFTYNRAAYLKQTLASVLLLSLNWKNCLSSLRAMVPNILNTCV